MKRIVFLSLFACALACSTSENAAPDLSLAMATVEFGDGEASQKIFVESNTAWTSLPSADWCKASIIQKFGSDTVEISVKINPSPDARQAYIAFTVADKTVMKTVKIIQHGIPQRRLDSLTLIRFYEAADGDNWAINAGWKTAKLEDWHGVTLDKGKIVGLRFVNNNLRGAIDELANLKDLDTIAIVAERGVVGAFPAAITQLPNLRYLNLSGLSISGAIPAEIGNMEALNTLILSSNPNLNRAQPVTEEIGRLTGLKYLSLDSMRVSETVFATLSNLEYLSLDSCSLDAGFPQSIMNLTNLEYLSLNNNLLYGPLPANILQLAKLDTLILANNSFTGAIPAELAARRLQTLRLEGNHLSGELPMALIDREGTTVCPQRGTNFSNNPCQ